MSTITDKHFPLSNIDVWKRLVIIFLTYIIDHATALVLFVCIGS